MLSAGLEHHPRSILVTSASPAEGKSTIALYLAAAHSQQQRRTLLIDGDMRRPVIKLGVSNDRGLSDVVNGTMHWREAVQTPYAYPDLDVLSAGPSSRRVADRIGMVLRSILDEAEREYDLVVIDSPPLLGFAEPLEIAALADSVIIVARAGRTNRSAVASVVEQLKRVRANIIGIVLNGVRADMSSQYYYYSPRYYSHYTTSRSLDSERRTDHKVIPTARVDVIYLYVWSGDAKRARDLVGSRYPGIEIREFPHRRLRESGFMERIRLLRGFRGRAIIFYFESLDDFKYRTDFECIHLLHRCQKTVLCDGGGRWETMRTIDILRSIPASFFQHPAGREDVDLLVVLSSPSPDACSTCCRRYGRRRT